MSQVPPAPTSGHAAPLPTPPPERLPTGWTERLVLVLGPVAVVFATWWLLGLWASPSAANEALAAGGIFLTFVGPSVIFGPAVVGQGAFEHLTTWDLVAVTAFFSLATAFFYSFNMDLLERLPKVGPWLGRARRGMRRTLVAKPWIKRWALLGVGFFVVLPLPGSGTLGGSIMGRLVGLSRTASFLAVGLGGVLVCMLYGYFGERLRVFGEAHQLPLAVKVAGALVFVVLLSLLGRWLAGQGRREAQVEAEEEASEGHGGPARRS